MKTNQLTINFNDMKKTTTKLNPRLNHNDQTRKYYNFLQLVKTELESKKINTLKGLIAKHNVSCLMSIFLRDHKVISKDTYGYYKWNEKISVSNLLIRKFRDYITINNKQRRLNTPNKLNNIKVVENKPKLIIRSAKMNNIGNEDIRDRDFAQKQEIGLIRKFLKWIY